LEISHLHYALLKYPYQVFHDIRRMTYRRFFPAAIDCRVFSNVDIMAFPMHAFLIIGQNSQALEIQIEKLLKKLKVCSLEFNLAKIEDVRGLDSFTNLKVDKPTAIIIKSIENATTQALNAFLKNLEEPQENLFYILTSLSEHALLPTIVSRCQLIRTTDPQAQSPDTAEVIKFLKMPQEEKLAFVDKIRKRDEAISFTEDIIRSCHELLHKTKDEHAFLARILQVSTVALARLKANGNVSLQLTNMVIGLV